MYKYVLQTPTFEGYLEAVRENRAPRFLGFGLFILHCLEKFEKDPGLDCIRLTATVHAGDGFSVAEPVLRHRFELVETDNAGTARVVADFHRKAAATLPFEMMGSGVLELSRADPQIRAALAESNPLKLTAKILELALYANQVFSPLDVLHDSEPFGA